MESDSFGNLDVLNKTLSSVSSEVRSVQSQSEAVSFGIIDLNVLLRIDLFHAFDFNELDIISVLVRVALILMHVHGGVLSVLNAANNELLCRFSILVRDHPLGAKIEEGITGQAHVF